jgi:hypothetical protein
MFGIMRLRRNAGQNVTFGGVATTREDGDNSSRLAGLDTRIVHSKMYYVQLQAVHSSTDSLGRAMRGGLYDAVWDRTGRAYGFHYDVKAIAPDFRAASGFVNRTGTFETSAANRVTFYGAPGALVQTWGTFVNVGRIRDYRRPRNGAIEGNEGISPSATLRGGWKLNGNLSRAFVSYTTNNYSAYTVERGVDTVGFVVPPPESGLFSGSLGITTPTFRKFTATTTVAMGDAALFREASRGNSLRIDGSVDLRPTSALRATFQFTRLALDRDGDGSKFSRESIPRLKVEYQLTRAIFVRAIGQYSSRSREPLRTATGDAILVNNRIDTGEKTNEFQMNWLFSYRPTPGTLFYLGYDSSLLEADAFAFSDLHRTRDGFFAKISYLFRM